MDEKIFFEHENVKITNARFIVGNQTYAMNGVTSVKSHLTPPQRGTPIAIGILGLLMLFIAEDIGKVVGLALMAFAVWLFMQQKGTHAVVLNSSSGEAQALTSTDEPYISSVVSALNEALIYRG